MKLKKVLKVLGIILGLLIVFLLVVFGQGEFFYGEINWNEPLHNHITSIPFLWGWLGFRNGHLSIEIIPYIKS